MCKKMNMINIGALDVYNELLKEWGSWSAIKLINLYSDVLNKDFEQNKTPAQIAKHIVKLYMAE